MKKAFILLLSPFGLLAQSKIIGYVTEQNSGKSRVANVSVKSVGANSRTSSTNGDFVLSYQDMNAGTSVVVRAEKGGWELVNEKEMSTFIPANPYEKPLKIVICKAGTLAKAKSDYYDTFEQNLYNEFKKLKAKYKGNQKEIARLEGEYARTQKQLNDLADEYSRINLDDASEKELEAIELFKAGKYAEFIDLKNGIVTEAEADKAIKNKQTAAKITANADSTIALYFKSQKDIAKTHIQLFQFKEAEETYKRMVLKDTTNVENTFEFAGFLSKQNQYDKAISYYQKALRLAKTELDVAITQNNLGNLYQAKNDYPAALSAFTKALEIREPLAQTNAATYEPGVAMTQNNLGILYQDKNDFPAALSSYTKALEIYERLAQTNPAAFEIEMCRSIVLIGLLQKAEYQAARQAQIDGYFEKAKQVLPKYSDIPIAKRLLNYVNDLEEYFNNVGVLLPIQSLLNQVEKERNQTTKIELQKKVVEKYLELIEHGNPMYANDLGSNLSNLAWHQLFVKQFAAAEKSVKEALNPTTFNKTEDYDTKIEWANTNLALALLFQGKYAEAEEVYSTLMDKSYNDATYRETFLADLEELEKAGITHPDVVKIRELLKK